MIAIVDYGLGNIRAFLNSFQRQNIDVISVQNAAELRKATKVILPGVGHFDHAMQLLHESGMREVLDDLALVKKVPLLGVCVGMQILGRGSEEGNLPGLGWIDGEVKHLASLQTTDRLPLPHMGWNNVEISVGHPLFSRLDTDPRFYFLHSYCFTCDREQDVIAIARYGSEFTCAVNSENIYGVQFHPEKSHHSGTQLLKNFAEL